jgi:hypothetical protein
VSAAGRRNLEVPNIRVAILRTIDADSDTAGNQSFVFIGGAAFSDTDRELRLAGGVLQGDVNGNDIPDIEIRVSGALLRPDILL